MTGSINLQKTITMNSAARSIVIATAAISLVVFSLATAFTASAAAPLAAGVLAIFTLTVMLVKSYSPRPVRARATAPRLAPVHSVRRVRVPAVVEYPVCRANVRAA